MGSAVGSAVSMLMVPLLSGRRMTAARLQSPFMEASYAAASEEENRLARTCFWTLKPVVTWEEVFDGRYSDVAWESTEVTKACVFGWTEGRSRNTKLFPSGRVKGPVVR